MRKQSQKQKRTSEVSSEVAVNNPSDCATEVVIAKSLTIAKRFHSMIAYFEANKPWIIELRARFGVSQGKEGKTLIVEGKEMCWREFVKNYFNVSLRYMNELLGIKEPNGNPKPNRKSDEEKPIYQRGYQAGCQSAQKYEAQIVELNKELKAAKTGAYKSMLLRLLEEVEKGGEGLPVSLTRLARSLRENLRKLDTLTPEMTEKVGGARKTKPEESGTPEVMAAVA